VVGPFGCFVLTAVLLLTHICLKSRNRAEIIVVGEIGKAIVCASRAARSRADGRNRRHDRWLTTRERSQSSLI